MAFVVTVQSNYCCDEFLALFRWSNLCTDSDRSELRLMRMVHTRERSGPSAYAITIFIAVKLHQHYRAFTKQIIIAQKRSRRMITTRLCDRWLTVSIFFFHFCYWSRTSRAAPTFVCCVSACISIWVCLCVPALQRSCTDRQRQLAYNVTNDWEKRDAYQVSW